MDLPKEVKNIIETIENNGFKAYVVGGCVRDYLLGKTPHDYDITTNAKPEDIKRIFKKTIDTGLKHGTVSIKGKEDIYEITTFRIDSNYSDGRHPDSVKFTDSIEEDLSRRDLTINAIAYSPSKGFIDPFNGQKDIKNKVLRTVGNPEDRFNEDALRMMRIIRFSCQLGFSIERESFYAVELLKNNIKKVSAERIQAELTKSILGKYNKNFEYFYSTKLLFIINDNFGYLTHFRNIISHLNITQNIPNEILKEEFIYPIVFMLEDKDIITSILKDLKFSNNILQKVQMSIGIIKDIRIAYKNKRKDLNLFVKELLYKFKVEDIFTFQHEIPLFQMIHFLKELFIKDLSDYYSLIWDELEIIRYRKEPICIKNLAINGNDLQNIGVKGKEIGIILDNILKEECWIDPKLNTKSQLIKLAKKYKVSLFIDKVVKGAN